MLPTVIGQGIRVIIEAMTDALARGKPVIVHRRLAVEPVLYYGRSVWLVYRVHMIGARAKGVRKLGVDVRRALGVIDEEEAIARGFILIPRRYYGRAEERPGTSRRRQRRWRVALFRRLQRQFREPRICGDGQAECARPRCGPASER